MKDTSSNKYGKWLKKIRANYHTYIQSGKATKAARLIAKLKVKDVRKPN